MIKIKKNNIEVEKFNITNDISATVDVSNEAHGYVKINTIDTIK